MWEQGVKYENRYLCGPRLVAELTGAAQRMVVGKAPDWVSFNGGVSVFLQHLRQGLGRPQIPEATEFLNKYFRNSRRRMGEGINEYITRKTETYWRACQALKRVMPKDANQFEGARGWAPWTPSQAASGGGTGGWNSRRSSWASDATGNEEEADNEGETTSRTEDTSWNDNRSWQSRSWQSNRSWGWQSYPGTWSWQGTPSHFGKPKETIEILPEFVQAWYLLADAGLSNYEKNLIHTAVGGEYTIARVSHELRTQHGESDGRRRDASGQAFWGEGHEDREDEATDYEDPDYDNADFDTSGFDEEEAALWGENKREIEAANAVMKEAKRTLRMAREKQHMVKMSRKYFRPSSSGSQDQPRDDSKMTCLRCGKLGHRARNCPQKPGEPQAPAKNREMAPFVCYAQASEEAMAADTINRMTTQEAVASGCCVIDGGATRTLGSVKAVEMVLRKNMNLHGEDRVRHVDTEDKPTFGFGNSSEGQCISTIHLGVTAANKPGNLVIHTLDEGEGPILFSIDALRKLGAIVDFHEDLIVFRALDPTKIVQLQRSQTGHQLMDLTADIFATARGTKTPVPSLKEYI